MQIQSITLSILLVTAAVNAAIGGSCTGAGGLSGVCVHTASCSKSGGTYITGACPHDPKDVKCCTKRDCGPGGAGTCKWKSDCSGSTLTGLCPGPADFKCCMPPTSPGHGCKRSIPPGC